MIPELLLEEILCGEKNEKDYYKKYGKDQLQAALAELKKSNDMILAEYKPEDMENEFLKRSVENKNDGSGPSVKVRGKIKISLSVIRFASAALLLFALMIPLLVKNIQTGRGLSAGEAALSDSGPVRIKGDAHHKIKLYRQSGNEVALLKNGDKAKENDLIQITYIPALYDYGVIFSVDGNKNITRHFPEASWKAEKLEKTGEEVPLSYSYALDDAPDFECFIFVASKNPFDLSEIEKIDSSRLNIEFLKKGTYLPQACDGSIFVLKKE